MSKKKSLRILAVLFAMVLTLCMAPMTANAAAKKPVSISAKSRNVYVGSKNKSLGVKTTKGAKVSYKSSSPSVVAVSSSGAVTAKKAGAAKITIKASEKGYKTATKTIKVKSVKRKNSITAANKSVYVGKTVSIGAKAKTTLTYKSSNTGIVTVSSKGVLTGKKAGTAYVTITAKATGVYNSASAKIKVTVKKTAPAAQKITASNKRVYVGKTVSIGAKAKTTLTYKSSNTKVVTVDSKGTLKGKKAGTAYVTISAKASSSYKAATCKIKVTVKKAPAKKNQSITASDKSVYVYETASIDAKAQTTLTYNSSNTEIVEVDSEGILWGKKAGTATITITAEASETFNSATKKITVTVTKQPNVISVEDANGFVFKVGDIWIPNLTCVDGTPDNMIFEISDPSVVGIEGDGYFVGYKEGTAVITVTAPETAKCTSTTIKFTVTVVKDKEPKKSNDVCYSFNDESTWYASRYMNWIMKKGTVVKLNAACENNSDVNWEINDPTIATIDSEGNIRGLRRGVVRVAMWVDETDEYSYGGIQFWLRIIDPEEDPSSYDGNMIIKEETSALLNAPCESDSAMNFESGNASVATEDVDGDVTVTEEQESSEIFMSNDCEDAVQEEIHME